MLTQGDLIIVHICRKKDGKDRISDSAVYVAPSTEGD
jgi:hypothetical protein